MSISATRLAERPAHVPDDLVRIFDLFGDERLKTDPYGRLRDLVDEAPPIFWSPCNGGHWVLRGFDAIAAAARDATRFSSEFRPYDWPKGPTAATPDGVMRMYQPLPIGVDPPIHGHFRTPLVQAFLPRVVMAMEAEIRALAAELIAQVRPHGRCELLSEVAEPFPLTIFLKMFGLPRERLGDSRTLIREYLNAVANPSPQDAQARMAGIVALMRGTIVERRDDPRDDLISALWSHRIDGRAMTQEAIEDYSINLFLGGLDTVMNSLGHGIGHMAADLDFQRMLRADPALVRPASEELLRRHSLNVPVRLVAHDLDFEGVRMRRGERVFLLIPAANLDPGQFDDPGQVRLQRENRNHMAFGSGPHRCLGSHLARLELQTFYQEFLKGIPEFTLDPDRERSFYTGHVIGVRALHLVWDPDGRP